MKLSKLRFLASVSCYGLIATALPAVATAQDEQTSDDDRVMNAVIVTAQKREESLQEVPLAITAASGEDLNERQISDVKSLSSIAPNLNVGDFAGQARISLRGIGFDTINPGAEGRVAYHVDGVYVSRPAAQLGTFFDAQRVEVLRGPQGTLYGRNATGGSINVITNDPGTELNGYLNATFGNYNHMRFEGAVGGEVSDGVGLRLAGVYSDRDGYGKSLVTGDDIDDENLFAGRLTAVLDPTSNVSIRLSADYSKQDDSAGVSHYFGQYDPATPLFPVSVYGGTVSLNDRDENTDQPGVNFHESYSTSANITVGLGDVDFRSISGWRNTEYRSAFDYDFTENNIAYFDFREDAEQFSQEFQLLGGDVSSDWILGAYYFTEDIDTFVHTPLEISGGLPEVLSDGYKVGGAIETEAWAVFGQYNRSLTDTLELTLGARYSEEEFSIDHAFEFSFTLPYMPGTPPMQGTGPDIFITSQDETSSNSFTPKIGLTYQPNDNLMAYGSVSRGYKSGGYSPGTFVGFDPEDIWAYEVGFKSETFNNALTANVAAFYYDYTNLQVSKVQGSNVIVENAATASIYGAELEFTARPTDALSFDGQIAYLHSEYGGGFTSIDPGFLLAGEVDLDGNQLYLAPEVTANLGAQYEIPIADAGALTLRGEANYVSRNYFTAFNADILSQEPYTKYNLFLTFEDSAKDWRATLFARNLTDETTKSAGLMGSSVYGSPAVGVYAAPRTYGIQVSRSF